MTIHSRGSSIEAWAPAKLNLFFELKARRDDGFHEIETLMVPISLYDTLLLEERSVPGIDFRCQWAGSVSGRDSPGDLPSGADNIVVQALEKLRVAAGIATGASARLIKRIPSAAGLGGGSSDAAAALVAANRLWQLDWPTARLSAMGAELGSDVPFFVELLDRGNMQAAVCRGRGERIEPIRQLAPLHIVLVRPPVGLSTAEVYRHCTVPAQPRDSTSMLAALVNGQLSHVGHRLHNALQPAAEQLSDWGRRLRDEFARLDFLGHQLSGSGTSYFGVCRHRGQARRLAQQLIGRQLGSVFVVQTAK